MDSLLIDYGHTDVLAIRYHGDSPWEYDPFYLANVAESQERYSYYSIITIPKNFIDGQPTHANCLLELYRDSMDERLEVPSPFSLVASDSMTVDSCFVAVRAIAGEDPGPDSLVLRTAVVEDSIYFEAPNTQTIFNHIFRSFVPDHDGISFLLAEGETLDVRLAFEMDPGWDPDHISSVVFIQNDSSREIYQAASSLARPAGWARFYAPLRGMMRLPGQQAGFPGIFINEGAGADTFDITLAEDLPADWSAGYEISGGDPVAGGFALAMDETCTITVKINCGYDPGTGEVTLTARSRRDPGFARSLDFFAVSGVCGLLVDDDGGLDYEVYYADALDSAGVVWGRWNRRIAKPLLSDLNSAEFVIWLTGAYFPTLEAHDQDVIASFIDGGGDLFISGQDIGYALCYGNSPEYSSSAVAFYQGYLGAEWIMPNANILELAGRPGDPVTDGIALSIEGGDGADNQSYPDVIDSIAPARVVFDYYGDPLKHGGVRQEIGSSKVVYLSFGFEGISSVQDRAELLTRIVDWFGGSAWVDGPREEITLSAYPNPAITHVSFSAPGYPGEVPLEVYDIRGRLVVATTIPERETFNWDLRDRDGHEVASGVYFVSMSPADRNLRKKIVLAR
ncbi:MAG: T9SS type A sorting domain-containing protein [bacterium]